MKKTQLINICKEIRDKYNIKQIISNEDQIWLIENVFRYHPEWEWWNNQGIKCISVGRSNKFGTKCFYIHFINPIDKATADISWNKCIANIKNEQLNK